MDLKDYKRVSSGSEFRDVVQTSDTEPRFRSNGHQLEFNASNSDYIGLNTEVSFTGDFFIEFDIDSKLDSNNQVLGINESGQTNISLFGGGKIFYNTDGNSAYLSTFGILPFTGRFKYKIERIGINTFFYVDGVQVDTVNNQNGAFTLNRLFASFTQSFAGDVYSVNINGETFNPTNINSNAQIVGSNGTIAQVNSSAADPINYVLGTVFQKRGFALAFDSGNSEYLILASVQTLSEDGDYLEISFTLDSLGQSSAIISETNVGDYLTILSDGRLFISTGTGDSLNTLVVTDLDNVVKVTRTATGLDVTLNGVTETTILTTDFNYDQFFRRSSGYLGGNINYINSNIENYPLRRGLGVELIGSNGTTAEIKTSAANPQQRVNFGMWLKGDNINGWNPYTV